MKLELREITKQFPGVLVNDRVSISVDRGEVLGLLGENGAGKSTLMNILSGLYRPDSGQVLIDGVQIHFKDPAEAIAAGIGMIHQHFMLVPVFDVVEAIAQELKRVVGRSEGLTNLPLGRALMRLPKSTAFMLILTPALKISPLAFASV